MMDHLFTAAAALAWAATVASAFYWGRAVGAQGANHADHYALENMAEYDPRKMEDR
jgi:hypothetical protein